VTRRTKNSDGWRTARGRYDAPSKETLGASDELLAQRLRQLRLPEPPPAYRERNRRSYGAWLEQDAGRNRWRG
jgi:hypothetical protein